MPSTAGIGVEARHKIQHLGLAGGVGKPVLEGAHPDLDGLAGLVPDVDLACRILAHQDHGEARRDALVLERRDRIGDARRARPAA